jgi:CelD/BcsL family acetyltransferase involved in cellulose biosynthesis
MDSTLRHTRSNQELPAAYATSLEGASKGIHLTVALKNETQLDCELITDFARLESIAREWTGLWTASPQSEVFQNFHWLRAAWRASGKQFSLFTPVVYRGAEVIGILPLTLKDGTLQFLGAPLSDYNDVICADEYVAEVMSEAFSALLRAQQHWKACVMENVAGHSRLVRHLPELPASLRQHFSTAFRCPCSTILMEPGQGVAKELARKQSLRRHENVLRRMGQVEFKHLEDRETIRRNLGTFFHQHIGRRAMVGDASHFMEERTRSMFEMLVEELDPRTMLRFGVLTLDNRPVAYHFGFEAKGKFIFYQPSFDIDLWKSSPGEVLLRQLFLYAEERKLSEFDLTRGGEAYKDRFATCVRENLTLHFNHDSGLRRQFHVGIQLADGGLRKTLEALRKHQPAYRIASNAALIWLGWWRREKRLMLSEGLRYPAGLIRRGFSSFIFARKATANFSIQQHEVAQYAAPLNDGLIVSRTTLGELAVISAMNPATCPPCREFQSRLTSGQQPYLIHQGAAPVQIWCVTAPSLTVPSGTAPGHEPSAQKPTLTVEHCWTASWFSGEGLRAMLREFSEGDMNVLVSCPENATVARQMSGLGLRVSYLSIYYRLLRWLHPVLVLRNGIPVSISASKKP